MVPAADLDPAQQAAVMSEAAPLCILAAAGSGKTRVLTHRIAHRIGTGAVDARHVLALTFTRKAAGELRGRLRSLGVDAAVTAGTFHAVAWAQVRRHAADLGRPHPTLLAAPARVVARLLPGADAATVAAVVGEIGWARARLVPPARYDEAARAAERSAPLPPAALAAVYEAYEAEKRTRRLLDFDDVLAACAEAVEAGGRFGEAQRWWFRHFFVDEFQDVNPLQFRLLRAWLGDRVDLTVVGDPNQAVYAWNGSDPRLLHRFTDYFPTAEVVRLDTAYRCPAEVLSVAAAVLGHGRDAGASPPRPPRRSDRPLAALPTVRAFHTDTAEARGIVHGLRAAHRPGGPWADAAVLVRTNTQREAIERALRAAGIPHRWHADDFRRSPEVRDALALLRRTPPSVPFSSALHDLDEVGATAEGDAARHLATLLGLAREYGAHDRSPSATGFADWLNLVVRSEDPDDGDGVTVATFHRAKGLEWPVVFVAGVEEGFVPIAHAATPDAEDEERRLLYVALTRATQEVHVSWAEQRTLGGRRVARAPSPWLPGIEQACARLAAARDRAAVDWRGHLAAGRARLVAGDSGRCEAHAHDPLPALRAWRAAAARAARVPAAAVVPDQALVAVAHARPRTHEELAAVPGIGPMKAAAHGDALLAVLAGVGVGGGRGVSAAAGAGTPA